jgi:Stress responsive A/B Barrel Domain
MSREEKNMNRLFRRSATLALGFALVGLATTAHASGNDKSASTAPFVHVVIVHLKPDAPADAADEIIADAREMLGKVPSVRDIAVGKPAKKSGTDRAKNDYQIGLLIRFDDLESYQAYEKHKLHLDFVAKHGKNVQLEKLTIYDFVDQKK